jgi:alpha-glucosidase
MLLTLRGTPFLYYGEELGMSCERIPRAALRDPMGIATWPLRSMGRDPERTPMQWDAGEGSGFSSGPSEGSGSPWLPLNSDYRSRNAAAQAIDPSSLLSWYKALIALRRARRELREGGIAFLDLAPDVLAYERTGRAGVGVIVLLNFASRRRRFEFARGGRVLLGSARAVGAEITAGSIELGPCEALIAEIGG